MRPLFAILATLLACATLGVGQQLTLTEALPVISFTADHQVQVGTTGAGILKIEAPGGFWINGRDIIATIAGAGGNTAATNADALGTTPTVELTDGALAWTADASGLSLKASGNALTLYGQLKVGADNIDDLLTAKGVAAAPTAGTPTPSESGIELEGAAGQISFTQASATVQRDSEGVLAVGGASVFVNGVDIVAAIATIVV